MTALAGLGADLALATSRYVAPPPPTPCPEGGDAFVPCLDLGPAARALHSGEAISHLRFAVGWQF